MDNSITQTKWYDKTWLVIVLCIFFFPVGLYALWKNSNIGKGWKIGVTAFYTLFVIIQLSKKEDKNIANEYSKTSTNADTKTTEKIKLKEQLKREIASFEKPFDPNSYRGSVESLQIEVILFSVWASIIQEGESSSDVENKKLASELRKKVVARQIKEFPKMRGNYGNAAAEKLWESNIYVTTEGASNNILNLTGSLFANNKNIAETQRTLSEIFTQFRFKEVRYRWYKGADEFTYYKPETPKDNEIIKLEK